MKLVADLHIHSHYSRATSRDLTFEHLARWAQLKGVHIVGTGDIAHPGWLQEMHDKLEPAEDGLFRLKQDIGDAVQAEVFPACRGFVRFMLAGEISNIYKRHGAVRKVHNVIFAPTLEAVAKIQLALEKIGNIRSDGRPILGLDSRDLLEIVLDVDPRCYLIPAHIWTPWFSMLGSKSGFDTVEECFGDLTEHIFALETGLSSDPPMNWRVSNLDGYTLVSNSDAHSPQKLAREATVFHTEPAYDALFAALHSGDPAAFGGTIEFFPEEGKYHLDGHRKCGVSWEPKTTLAHGGRCSVCGKPVTVGVMHRVETLADRPEGGKPARTHPYASLIPLPEILGEVHGVGPNTRTVRNAYEKLLSRLGPELAILQDAPLEEIAAVGGERLAHGIGNMRRDTVLAEAGYDGEYGVIRVLAGDEADDDAGQPGLFPDAAPRPTRAAESKPAFAPASDSDVEGIADSDAPESLAESAEPGAGWEALPLFELPPIQQGAPADEWLARLNDEQRAAVHCVDRPLIIAAGPGTGKTRTLTVRIAHIVRTLGAQPESILAITFTNKAAGEMGERLAGLLGSGMAQRLTIKTFHAFGAHLLRRYGESLGLPSDFAIPGESDRLALLRQTRPDLSEAQAARYLDAISSAKNRLVTADAPEMDAELAGLFADGEDAGSIDAAGVYRAYDAALRAAHLLDFDDLLLLAVRLCEEHAGILDEIRATYRWISVDEYQDVNLAQYRLLRLLAGDGANLCVIGDPDQAIYGFRGADHRYFLSFQQDFPGARLLALRQSYRSPQSLLDAAAQVISHNPDRAAVELWSEFVEQVKLDIHHAPTDRAEAETIVHRIEQMVGGSSLFSLDSGRVDESAAGERSFGDFAVLYRLGAQARLLVEAFERSGIPYQVAGATSWLQRADVRPILDCLWLLQSPRSRLHRARILAAAGVDFTQAWQFAQDGETPIPAWLRGVGEKTRGGARRQRLLRLADLWEGWQAETSGAVSDLIRCIEAAWAELEAPKANAGEQERMQQLARFAAPYGADLAGFLETVSLQSEADAFDPRAERVTLMTLHAAKGLEFPVVFIAGCEEGLLPYLPESERRSDNVADVEEERRLFYVGMTRAGEKLILTAARRRFLFGKQAELPLSRFVSDIEAALLEIQEHAARPQRRPRTDDLQLTLF